MFSPIRPVGMSPASPRFQAGRAGHDPTTVSADAFINRVNSSERQVGFADPLHLHELSANLGEDGNVVIITPRGGTAVNATLPVTDGRIALDDAANALYTATTGGGKDKASAAGAAVALLP